MSPEQRKSMERGIDKLSRQVKGIKGDISILRELRDNNARLSRRIEHVNQTESNRYAELAGFYSDKLKAKSEELHEVECSLAWERDKYTRMTTTE